jgi:hypothetical protein
MSYRVRRIIVVTRGAVRVACTRAADVVVGHNDPLNARGHECGNGPLRERHFRREKALGVVTGSGTPRVFIHDLVNRDLHCQRCRVDERGKGVVVREGDLHPNTRCKQVQH